MIRKGRTAVELEDEADLRRRRIEDGLRQLGENLKPNNLAREIVSSAGINELTPSNIVAVAVRRYPVPILLVSLGLGVLGLSLPRASRRGGSVASTAEAVAGAASDHFRVAATQKRREFVLAAQRQLSTHAAQISEALGKTTSDALSRLGAPLELQPLVVPALQMLLFSALEGLASTSRRQLDD